jgi:MerR family transcriptional regulator, light-induced transcriptional regulator
MNLTKYYPIAEVIKLTGTTEFLLRAWELRYKLVNPKRTDTGRRLYSSADVMKISKIQALLAQGCKIRHLASLSLVELQKMEKKTVRQTFEETIETSVVQVFNLLTKTDWSGIQNIFKEQKSRRPSLDFVMNFIVSVASQMAKKSLLRQIDIIQEHILSSLIKEHLYSLSPAKKQKLNKSRTVFLFATVEGDHHDLGLLMSKVIAEQLGFRCVYLGSHVPKKDLVEACLRLKATHLVISTSLAGQKKSKDDLLKYIHFLDQHLSDSTQLWLGGQAMNHLTIVLTRKLVIFKSLKDYEVTLSLLAKESR